MTSCAEQFPEHLRSLMKTSKYVHLATCSTDCIPSVSLMNYTYVPCHENFNPAEDKNDYIIFTAFKNSEKYLNIEKNPYVSLLFHDWVKANNLSVRKASISQTNTPVNEQNSSEDLPPPMESTASGKSRLLNLLQELNQAELNQMSANIRGHATILDKDSDESKFYKHILHKTNPDAEVFILGDNSEVIKVKIESAKVTDSENNTSVYD